MKVWIVKEWIKYEGPGGMWIFLHEFHARVFLLKKVNEVRPSDHHASFDIRQQEVLLSVPESS